MNNQLVLASFFASVLCLPVPAQVAYSLQRSIPAPAAVRVQSDAYFGGSVAVEGGFTVVGANQADTSAFNSGLVKVFASGTGALLYTLTAPGPATGDNFGYPVAISGSRVIASAPGSLSSGGGGTVYVYDLSGATPTVPVATLHNPSPTGSGQFGTRVGISGSRVVVVNPHDDTGVADSGSVYVFDLGTGTPTVPVATLKHPSPTTGGYFGTAVGISGTRVVVGVSLDDVPLTNAGRAFVYDLSSATPTVPVSTLNNPGPAVNDVFGGSVAISGTQVVVGASQDDTGATNAGSAYVYDLSSATPTVPIRTLNNPAPGAGDSFGYAVSISGTRVLVGAFMDDTGAINAGSAYGYDLNSGTPTVPVVTLNNPGSGASVHFGISVAISGTSVVVGVPDGSAGGAYVYDLSHAPPTQPVAILTNAAPPAGDNFGNAVAISGTRFVVGASREDTGAKDAGSAYAYDLSSSMPTVPVATFRNPVPVDSDYFGRSVAISGTRVVVGAPADGTSGGDQGSAYVYDLSSATPVIPVVRLDNPGLPGSHLFGGSVAIAGTRVVVGASYDDTGASGAGRAYIYDVSSATPTVPVVTLDNPNPAPGDHFGSSVAISGARVVVGALEADIGATDAGRVYVFDLGGVTPGDPVTTLNNPTPGTTEEFGYAVAISGTRIVVGTPGDDTGATDAGIAYVYELSSSTPKVPIATLNNPSPAPNDYFGISVAISGTRVVVGAWQDDTGAANAGSAYVYDLSSATPTVPVATINNPSPASNDNFAFSVAMDGPAIAIGVPFAESPQADEGTAYIFTSDADGDGLLDGWEIAHFGTTTGHGPLDDFDGDGYNELLELAFGLNPTVTNPGGLPPVTSEGGYLTMTLTKQPGVTYEVQSAGTLLPGLPGSFSAAGTKVLLNDATTLKARDNILPGGAARRFIRVKVTAAP